MASVAPNLPRSRLQRASDWRFTQLVRLDNATNRRYAGSVIVNEANGRYFEPAPGRNWFAGVTLDVAF